MTDRMSNERIAELAHEYHGSMRCHFHSREAAAALRQTRADLAQAEATIAARDAENARLRAALAAAERKGAEGWQPIETAPKNQSVILWRPTMLCGTGHIGKGKWQTDEFAKMPRPFWESDERWIYKSEDRQNLPTHWMPLPLPPSTRDGVNTQEAAHSDPDAQP